MKDIYDVVIIGAGPAGMTAALYAIQSGMKTAIVEAGAPGGKLLQTHLIDNFIGAPTHKGYELAQKFYSHISNEKDIDFINDKVEKIIDTKERIKIINLLSNKSIQTKTIIITTGLKPKLPKIENVKKYFGKGISTCLVCDGALYKNKNIAVIGGGLSASEEVLYNHQLFKKIHLLNPYPSFRIEKDFLNKLENLKNTKIQLNTNITDVLFDEEKRKFSLELNSNTKLKDIDGIFLYLGWISTIDFLEDKIKEEILDAEGYIKVDKNQETRIKGIFAAGDIVKKEFKQVTIATSEGTIAALTAKKYRDS